MTQLGDLLMMIESGHGVSEKQFSEAVFEEIHQLAKRRMARERADHTLQATALVNEVWLRLMNPQKKVVFRDKQHFHAVVGKTMRQILVDHARARKADRRNRGRTMRLDKITSESLAARQDNSPETLVLLNDLQEYLLENKKITQLQQTVFDLHFWSGKTHAEIADDLGIGVDAIGRAWRAAQLIIAVHLDKDHDA